MRKCPIPLNSSTPAIRTRTGIAAFFQNACFLPDALAAGWAMGTLFSGVCTAAGGDAGSLAPH